MVSGLVVAGRRRVVRQEVRPGRGGVEGGRVVRQGRAHGGTVGGQCGGQPVVLNQGRVVAGARGHAQHLLLPVGVGLLVLPVVRRGDVDLNVDGVREEA